MKALRVLVVFILNIGISYADMIAMSESEIQLQQKFYAYATQEDASEAFKSRHHLLHLEAIKWLIVNRNIATWSILRDQKSKLKETSLQLCPILELLAEKNIEPSQPLILALKPEHLKMLILKGEEIPPRYTDGDPPVDLVLYEILEKDLRRMPAQGTPTARATEMLNSYQAPPKKNEPRLNPKVASDRFSDEAPPI